MHGKPRNARARALLRPFAIPAITPLALAIFRALLGGGLLYILLQYEPFAVRSPMHNPHSPFADVGLLYRLAASRTAMQTFEIVGCASAALFAVGIWARPAYFVLAASVLLDVLFVLGRTGGHNWGLPLVTILALTVVRWGDAPNLFTIARHPRRFSNKALASAASGFAVWLPGLTIGLSFLAAAYAKVVVTGIRWITNGTVRYHFVEDGRDAPVSLGLWIATHPMLAVALSLAAVIVEATFISVIFVRGWRARLALGLMGASLMIGFTLFQGIAWWPWRILFVAFLPWTLLTTGDDPPATLTASTEPSFPPRPRDLAWVHAFVVFLLIGTQMWATVRRVEIEPFVSNYPMYAYTWSSPDEFERAQVRMRFEAGGVDITDRVNSIEGHNVLRGIVSGEFNHGHDAEGQDALASFASRYRQTYGAAPPAIDVVFIHRPFDWQNGKYLPEFREHVDTIRFTATAAARSLPPSAAAVVR